MMDEIDRLVDQQRAELERTFAQKHKNLIDTTEVFRQTLEVCKTRGWDTHAQIWNLGIYINIAAHDLSILVMQLHFEREAWARRQVARHAVLTIYEVVEDMTQLLGKRIREPLDTLGLLSRYDADLRKVRQPLDQFWKLNQKKLSDVRCMTTAHRELDGLSLLRAVESIDIIEIVRLGFEVDRILKGIAHVVQSILHTIPPPETN